jgi:hypothetical protein
LLSPTSYRNLKISFILRIDNLFAGICTSRLIQKAQDTTPGYPAPLSASIFGEYPLTRITDETYVQPTPGWPLSIGFGGRFASESVAGFNRNGWPLSVGIGGRFASEYAIEERLKQMMVDPDSLWEDPDLKKLAA